jgi:N-acetylneuraminic acid mutarotase
MMIAAQSLMAEGWQKMPPMPEASGGFVVGEQEGRIFVLGGTNWRDEVKHYLTSVYAFDPREMQWMKMASLSEPIAYAVSGTVDGHLMWAGGTRSGPSVKRAGTLDKVVTTSEAKALPDRVVVSAGGVIGEELVFVGGTDEVNDLTHLTRAAFSRNVKSGKITELPEFPGKPFGTAGSAVIGDRLFIFGGANWDFEKETVVNTADAYALSLSKREWKRLTSLPFVVRGMHGIPLNDRLIYLLGGYKNDVEEFGSETFFYDTETDRYLPGPPAPYRGLVELVICDGFLYCVGGEDRKKSRTDQCWRIPVRELLEVANR